MVITEADLWMLPNPLQVQIKSITAKPCFLHRGIVFSNLFPVCLQMHICTSLYNQSLKKKIKIEVYHRNGTACEGEKKMRLRLNSNLISLLWLHVAYGYQHTETWAENLLPQSLLQKKKNRWGLQGGFAKKHKWDVRPVSEFLLSQNVCFTDN